MTARFIQSHRTLARLFVRGPVKAWVSRRVWSEALANPSFIVAMDQVKADHTCFYRWSEVKGSRNGGPTPRCGKCGAMGTPYRKAQP